MLRTKSTWADVFTRFVADLTVASFLARLIFDRTTRADFSADVNVLTFAMDLSWASYHSLRLSRPYLAPLTSPSCRPHLAASRRGRSLVDERVAVLAKLAAWAGLSSGHARRRR
jgi:hypothetical protein